MGSEDGEDATAGGDARAYAGGGVFDDDAVGAGEAEELGSALVGLRVGFAVDDHLGGDEAFGDGKLGVAEAALDEAAGAGGDDGPAVRGKAAEEGADAGQDLKVGGVGDFEVFNDLEGGVGVDVGAELLDDVLRSNSMGDFVGVGVGDVVEAGPLAPAADDRADGRDEDPVVVEENAFGFDVDRCAQAGAP